MKERIEPAILGGDPFCRLFRGLYNSRRFWKLADPEYCLQVMEAAYEGGVRAFDLSFPRNVELFKCLQERVDGEIVAFGNPTWKQGVKLYNRHFQYYRDRILKTIVEEKLPAQLAEMVKNRLSEKASMVFAYDREVELLSAEDIENIYLDECRFRERLSELDVSRYIMLGGSDADWLFSLGRSDLIAKMVTIVRDEGFIPLLLCHYASLVLPAAEERGLDVEGYVFPLNREWSWFDREDTLAAIKNIDKWLISFMALGSGVLRNDVEGALSYLFTDCNIDSVLYGTTSPENAEETACIIRKLKG